jgi:hypothetical protein
MPERTDLYARRAAVWGETRRGVRDRRRGHVAILEVGYAGDRWMRRRESGRCRAAADASSMGSRVSATNKHCKIWRPNPWLSSSRNSCGRYSRKWPVDRTADAEFVGYVLAEAGGMPVVHANA